MNDNTIMLIEKFGDTIEQYGSDLFVIAQKQLYVEVVQFIVVMCVTIIAVVVSKKYLKERVEPSSYDLDMPKVLIIIVLCILSLILFVILMSIIQWVINPEYASIKLILSLINNGGL